ncbi:hypothetical protein RRG08_043304 [Elysia crispata]|uniref:Uncharacterized protein n=1 Tax=Elysia crispata TaxID=231223 RepID=A0AAE1CNY5_9GAST|nr:hypothetical protein RRG08_043304 [Elysia crispata]
MINARFTVTVVRTFSAVCPELHSQASVVYSHLKGAFAVCEEASMVLLGMIKSPFSENVSDDKVSDQTESTVPQSSSMSMVITTSHLTDTHILNVVSMDSLDIWCHNNFKWYLTTFQVIDMTFGFTFKNLDSFLLRKSIQSNPYVLPKIATLNCSKEFTKSSATPMGTFHNKRAAQVLPHCRVLELRNMKSSFRRNCYNRDLRKVFCMCGMPNDPRGVSSQNIYDACLGEYSNILFTAATTLKKTQQHRSMIKNIAKQTVFTKTKL